MTSRPAILPWLAAVLVAACAIPAWASPDTARESLERHEYPAARSEYERLLAGRPDDARLAYNAGVAAFRQKDLDGAARHFESVLGTEDLRLQERAYFNLGNTRFRQGEAATDGADKQRLWQDAEKQFEAALGLDSSDVDAKANLETVRQQLAALPQPQQSPDGQPKDKDKDKDSDKGKKKDGQDSKSGDSKDPSKSDGKKGGPQEKNDPSKSGKSKDDASRKPGDGDDKKGASNKDQPGMEQGEKKPQSGKEDASKPGGEKGPKEGQGQGDGDPKGKDGKPQRAESGAGGEGQGAGMEPETPEGQMALRFAERLLDGHKSEERALIWRPATSSREPGSIQGRRKTW